MIRRRFDDLLAKLHSIKLNAFIIATLKIKVPFSSLYNWMGDGKLRSGAMRGHFQGDDGYWFPSGVDGGMNMKRGMMPGPEPVCYFCSRYVSSLLLNVPAQQDESWEFNHDTDPETLMSALILSTQAGQMHACLEQNANCYSPLSSEWKIDALGRIWR